MSNMNGDPLRADSLGSGRLVRPEPARPVSPSTGDGFAAHAQPNPPNPLRLIPADWREAVAVLWTCNAHLLPSALALCSRLRVYQESAGLTTDEVRAICRVLVEPERAARHRFAADLLADLAGMVGECKARRKGREQTARMREDGEAFKAPGLSGPGELFTEFGIDDL